MSLMVWLIAMAITAGAAAIQGTVGVGFAMVAVPLLSLVNPDLAPVPQLLVILPITIAMAWREREAMDLRGVGWIIVGRFPGLALGVAMLAVATQRTLDMFIGVVVLVAVTVLATGFHIQRTSGTKFAAGVASGTTGVVVSIGGPPVALLYSNDEAATVRSTLAAVFAIGVSLSAAARLATGNMSMMDVHIALVLFPAAVAGYLVSVRYKDRVPAGTARAAILGVSAAAAVALIVRAIVA